MKILRLFAVLPLLMGGLDLTVTAADSVVTPEQLFPQLDGILKKAVAQSPRMITRAIDLEYAENNRIAARAGLLPSAAGSFNYYEARDDRDDGNGRLPLTKLGYNFTVSQPLYYWGDRRNAARIGEIQQAMAQGQFREGYRLLAQEVRNSYLRLILNKMIVKKTKFYAESSNKAMMQAEERLLKKVISDAQIFGVRLDAERARLSFERNSFEAEIQKAAFARLTGTPVLSDDEIPDSVPTIPEQNEAIQRLLAGYLGQKDPVAIEAEVFRQNQVIEGYNLQAQKNRLKPKLNLIIGLSQDEQSYTRDVGAKYTVNSYYGGVSVYWTIFDGFAARSGVRNGLAKLRQMDLDYRALTENLAVQAQNQVRLIGFSTRSVSINDRLLVSGEGNMNYRNEQFTRGVIAEEDVNTARLGFYDAQINACTARVDYFTQVCSFLGMVREDPVVANLPVK